MNKITYLIAQIRASSSSSISTVPFNYPITITATFISFPKLVEPNKMKQTLSIYYCPAFGLNNCHKYSERAHRQKLIIQLPCCPYTCLSIASVHHEKLVNVPCTPL